MEQKQTLMVVGSNYFHITCADQSKEMAPRLILTFAPAPAPAPRLPQFCFYLNYKDEKEFIEYVESELARFKAVCDGIR